MKKERINKFRVTNEQVLLALLFLEDVVTVGLIFAQKAVVVELGGKSLRLALPLGNDLTLLFDLFVGVVELFPAAS